MGRGRDPSSPERVPILTRSVVLEGLCIEHFVIYRSAKHPTNKQIHGVLSEVFIVEELAVTHN